MEGLGRVFNIVPTAAGVEVDMSQCQAVTFVCVGDEAYTVREAEDGVGTGVQDLVVVDRFYKGPPSATAKWTLETQTASATVDPNDATNTVVVFTIEAASLSDGFTHVLVNNTTSGLVTAIPHDLTVQRSAEKLDALTG